jgi:preprotein translocase subunit SecE
VARTRTRSLEQPDDTIDQEMEAVSTGRRRGEEAEESSQVARKNRPTPSARQIKPKGSGSTGLVNRIPVVRGVVGYFRGVITELRKVTWPTRDEATRLTAIVVGVTIVFAAILGVLDMFLVWWFRKAFHSSTQGMFGLIAIAVLVVSGGAFVYIRTHLIE